MTMQLDQCLSLPPPSLVSPSLSPSLSPSASPPSLSSADDFIDVILGNRVYMKCIYVSYTKTERKGLNRQCVYITTTDPFIIASKGHLHILLGSVAMLSGVFL